MNFRQESQRIFRVFRADVSSGHETWLTCITYVRRSIFSPLKFATLWDYLFYAKILTNNYHNRYSEAF